MERGSLDLRFLVDGLDADGLDELREALASRLCRKKYDADTIESLLAKWGHKVFSTLGGWQDCVMLSGCVWIDEMYFENIRVEHEDGKLRKKGLSKDKVCLIVAIDS